MKKNSDHTSLDLFSNIQDEDDFILDEEEDHGIEDDVYQRACTLSVAEPLLGTNVTARRHPFHLLDYKSLALQALEFSIRSVGLGSIAEGGVQRETMINYLINLIEEQLLSLDNVAFEQPDAEEIADYARTVVNELLHTKSLTGFSANIFNPGSKSFRNLQFRVFEESDDIENNFYIRPSVESTNLYLSVLDQSLEDAQVALQALLEHQIRQGKIKNAFRTAKVLRTKTLFYKDEVLRFNRKISTNIRNVSWQKHVQPKIAEIQNGLPALLQTNRRILNTIEGNLELREGERRKMVASLISTIKECIDTHIGLKKVVNNLDKHYRNEQVRQSFFIQANSRLPDMVDEVLVPLLRTKLENLDELTERLTEQLVPPSASPVFDLTTVILAALREKRTLDNVVAEDKGLDMGEPATEEPPNVTTHQQDLAGEYILRQVLVGNNLLSQIMQSGIEEELATAVLHAIPLTAHAAWQDGNHKDKWTVEKLDSTFHNEICRGNDFKVRALERIERNAS